VTADLDDGVPGTNPPSTSSPDTNPLEAAVLQSLASVIDPEIRRPVTELNMISGVSVDDAGAASVGLTLTIVGCPAATSIERDVREATARVAGITGVTVDVSIMSRAERDALTHKLRKGRPKTMQFGPDSLTQIVAVTSGKGGVGKSTLTANLAVSLAQSGLRVGVIDADVFGFSIPGLLGLHGAKPTQVGEMILPPVAYDVKVISIGMFVEENTAVSWRGPMLHRTIQQFLTDVYFGDLDVLLLDLPPGTGDVAISLGQLLPHSDVVVVTTPQSAAADVAERSGLVARQTGQRVIGVIENMAGLPQPDGSVLELFGSGGGADAAAKLSTPDEPVSVLASIPLSIALREGGDVGVPVVIAAPEDPAAQAIHALAATLRSLKRSVAGRKLGLSLS
jgi:ATP-binding protein involved in chromosome partitioning